MSSSYHSKVRSTQSKGVTLTLLVTVLVKNYGVYSNLTKHDPLSTLKGLCVNSFVN